MKLKTRQITVTAILLAICIVSQFFKNVSVYLTGPIINAALILTTVYAGLACGIILSVITPITSFFITGSPIMAAIPAMFPCINRKCNSRPCCCPAPQKIRGKSRTSGICCDRCCIKGSVYGNSYFSYYLTKYVACKNAANVTCSAAAVFCHAADYCPDRRGVCNHYSCNIAKYHSG